jgi:predicted PurR-regulated permease PerM
MAEPLPLNLPPTMHERRLAGVATAVLLALVLWSRLFSAMLSALVAYSLATALIARLAHHMPARRAAVLGMLLATLLLLVLVAAIPTGLYDMWGPQGGLPHFLNLLADLLERVRSTVPPWIASRIPDSVAQVQQLGADWLRANAQDVRGWGQSGLRILAHVFVGLVIGLLSAIERLPQRSARWLRAGAAALQNLAAAFADIVAAQLRIAAANAALTALFLLVALPLAGVRMPLATPLVMLTFVLGLVPIIGNLFSNGAILIVALTVSPVVALAALLFLLGIHKLEYVLNAHFVAGRTSVPAPVLLGSMLLLEALFGVAGLIAAPVLCAWAFRQFAAIDAPAP